MLIADVYYDKEDVEDVVLKPIKKEDIDKLYVYSQIINIKNPAIMFSEDAKAGFFNELTDEEYYIALERIKFVSETFFNKVTETNIFQLTADLLKFIMQHDEIWLNDDVKNRLREKGIFL